MATFKENGTLLQAYQILKGGRKAVASSYREVWTWAPVTLNLRFWLQKDRCFRQYLAFVQVQ